MNAMHGRPGRKSTALRWLLWAFVPVALLVPLVAMQFTREVNWTGFDFAAAALLLVGGGLGLEAATLLFVDRKLRAVIAALVLAAVALVWAHGAVGVF
jgi:hypothetical protein